jgi:PilZ domain-containing protein
MRRFGQFPQIPKILQLTSVATLAKIWPTLLNRFMRAASVFHVRSWVKTESTMQVTTGPSRRRTSRISIADSVWVYWESLSGRDVSRVKDLSPSGLFIETRARKHEGDLLNLHFLVQEGQIRAEAIVRHATSGRGLGMKINSVPSQDAPQLHRLLTRLREAPKLPQAR